MLMQQLHQTVKATLDCVLAASNAPSPLLLKPWLRRAAPRLLQLLYIASGTAHVNSKIELLVPFFLNNRIRNTADPVNFNFDNIAGLEPKWRLAEAANTRWSPRENEISRF